jgi:hypothetical protein
MGGERSRNEDSVGGAGDVAQEPPGAASVLVKDGGVAGNAKAICHGVARALMVADPDVCRTLRRAGYLTRDPRAKERKKPGLKRVRKAPQYTRRWRLGAGAISSRACPGGLAALRLPQLRCRAVRPLCVVFRQDHTFHS